MNNYETNLLTGVTLTSQKHNTNLIRIKNLETDRLTEKTNKETNKNERERMRDKDREIKGGRQREPNKDALRKKE